MKTLKRDKVVLNFRETPREQRGTLGGQYPNVVKDKIYYQMEEPKEVHYAIQKENSYIKPESNVTIKKSLSAQNFSAFYDTNPNINEDERYKAVGGYHVGRSAVENYKQGIESKLYNHLNDCPISNDLEVVPHPDPVWPQYTRLLFKDDFHHPRHANGLYVFKSSDGIDWKEYHDLPVISSFDSCEENEENPNNTGIGHDTLPSIFYDHNIDEYVMYIRANLSLGVRHVFYTHSKDLINWSKPSLIKIDPAFDLNHDNLYFMSAFPFGRKYIAFPPYFKNSVVSHVTGKEKVFDKEKRDWVWGDPGGPVSAEKNGHQRNYWDAKTLVMISDDRLNWKVVDTILPSETRGHMTFPHVVSFREEDDGYALYVHEEFMTFTNKLVRYTIDYEELEKYLDT